MRKSKKVVAGMLVCALVGSCMPVSVSGAKVSKKGYTLSKKAGTYEGTVKVKLTAKKGYNVYYSTGKSLSTGKKVKAKKSKTFTFKKTSTLRVYAVKSSKKMTKKKLKAIKSGVIAKYQYKIVAKSDALERQSPNTTATNAGGSSTSTATSQPTNTATNDPGVIATPTATAMVNPLQTPGDSQYEGDDSLSGYVEPVRVVFDSEDENVSTEGATTITMPATASGSKVTKDNYEISKKNKLTIKAPGTYVVQSNKGETVDGLIEVDYPDETVTGTAHLILNGLQMTSSNNTEPTSDTGLITVKSSVTRAIITVADGTVNTLTDAGETGIDKDDGVSTTYTAGIVCKKTPLTINGKGTLNITSKNGNGIKCTNDMKIMDSKICVSGPDETATGHNGITAKLDLALKNADISIHSHGDALKTTLDETDVKEDTTLVQRGNMEIDGGTYKLISENGDGISVYRTLYLNPTSLTVTTKNAAGSTEDSSYKGIKAGVTIFVAETAGEIKIDTTATYSASRVKGDSNDSLADDTIHSNGYIRIDGGTMDLKSGDDGIHADNGLVINGGKITATGYEGLESADISINGGEITVTTRDDGINAGGGNDGVTGDGPRKPGDWFDKGDNASVSQFQIIIRGGVLNIDAQGDGIDSNGNIFFQGGTIIVNGPSGSGNGALDYGDRNCVCEISGGTLIAAGAVGMDVAPTSGSSQPAVNVRLSASQSADTYVVLKDGDGKTVVQARPTKTFQSVVMSSPELKMGSTYTIHYGKDLNSLTQGDSVTFTSISMSTGSTGGGGWGRPPR